MLGAWLIRVLWRVMRAGGTRAHPSSVRKVVLGYICWERMFAGGTQEAPDSPLSSWKIRVGMCGEEYFPARIMEAFYCSGKCDLFPCSRGPRNFSYSASRSRCCGTCPGPRRIYTTEASYKRGFAAGDIHARQIAVEVMENLVGFYISDAHL